MPGRHRGRPLKAWRYVAVFAEDVALCACRLRLGSAGDTFWAVWDRRAGVLREASGPRAGVHLLPGRLLIRHRDVEADLSLLEGAGIETICETGPASRASYTWTRKQGGVAARGPLAVRGAERFLDARAVVDDSAGYHPRHTCWFWSAGVGLSTAGQALAWNLVSGINDPPQGSERTVWVDGVPQEPGPSRFAPDLSAVDGLRFQPEALREHRRNLLLVRSRLVQPFGSFSGHLLPGLELAQGHGVMEFHDVRW